MTTSGICGAALLRLGALLLGAGLCTASYADHGSSLTAVDNAPWRAECGSCHIAYHPAFLPERSWRKLMGDLDHHFGTNASLDAVTAKRIADFLAANAADRGGAKRGDKVAASIPGTQTPLRVSETPWFVRKHDEVRADLWRHKSVGSAANCGACHPGAEKDRFDESQISMPGLARRMH